jgi:transcriptional regulator with XRE-family HTH domain
MQAEGQPGAYPGPFARMLRQFRLDRRLTQEELAQAAGLSVRAVRNAELGRVRSPRMASVQRLVDALALPVEAERQLVDTARSCRVFRHPTDAVDSGSVAGANAVYLEPDANVTLVVGQIDDGRSTIRVNATASIQDGRMAILFHFDHVEQGDLASKALRPAGGVG